jgi:hypothetical protein
LCSVVFYGFIFGLLPDPKVALSRLVNNGNQCSTVQVTKCGCVGSYILYPKGISSPMLTAYLLRPIPYIISLVIWGLFCYLKFDMHSTDGAEERGKVVIVTRPLDLYTFSYFIKKFKSIFLTTFANVQF